MIKYNIVFPQKCKKCDFVAKDLDSLRNHIVRKHKLIFSIYLKDEYFINIHERKKHTRSIEFPIKCVICEKEIKSLSGLGTHLKNKHKDINYEEYLKENFNLDISKNKEEQVKCEICNKNFYNLKQHIRRTHKISIENYEKEYGKIKINDNVKKRCCSGVVDYSLSIKGISPKERFILQFGQEGEKKYKTWRDNMKGVFSKEWFIEKNGIEKGTELYEQRSETISINSKNIDYSNHNKNKNKWSKISQKLFWEIYKNIEFEKVYFGELNHEFGCHTNRNFDFVIDDIKKVIEYNGESFHPRETMTKEEWNNWRQVFGNKTANQAKKDDDDKIQGAVKNGYSVFIVWHNDYKCEPEKVLKDCLNFIRN